METTGVEPAKSCMQNTRPTVEHRSRQIFENNVDTLIVTTVPTKKLDHYLKGRSCKPGKTMTLKLD